jgi:pimeloyl-ACP methyl ester carboxylesterase/1-acyl-sn-glycerol-3-phosphate acyltransferase
MMWGLNKITAALLAASTPNRKQYVPDSTVQIANDFRAIYNTLSEKGPIFQRYSPTVKFTYVSPPQSDGQDWRDEEVLLADADLLTTAASDHDREGKGDGNLFVKVARRHGQDKPIALYLPGLDGFGISAAMWQFNDLAKTFELWRMTVSTDDRTSFHQLVQKPVQFLDDVAASMSNDTGRPVYIIGESFGGLLATAVSLQLVNREKRGEKENPIKGIVLVNPATSFDESSWDVIAPILTTLGKVTEPKDSRRAPFALPSVYSLVGGLTLSAVIPSQQQLRRILGTFVKMESIRDPTRLAETVRGYLDMFQITSDFLPPGLLEHRIKNWLIVGTSLVDSRLSQLDIPSLIVVGTADQLIRSGSEADRLTKLLPRAEKLQVPEAGHFVLDDNVNLTEAILYSKLDPLNFKETRKPYDPIVDWQVPAKEVMEQVLNTTVKQLEDAFSPVFVSTNSYGQRVMGLGNVPKDGPILFVSNHQLCMLDRFACCSYWPLLVFVLVAQSHTLHSCCFCHVESVGADLSFLVAKLFKNGILVRGLGHPVLFQSFPGGDGSLRTSDELGRVPGLRPSETLTTGPNNYPTFGAVKVTPRNFYRLMQTGQNALLFPGGVREVFHGKNESYQIFWPEKVDFVRTAARFNATIVPISSVGMADSFNFLLDSSELGNIPIFGERAKEFAKNVTAARFDADDQEESFLPPLVTPSLPSRNYFVFGKPTYTQFIDPRDKEACMDAYKAIQREMKRGFDDILEAREKDAFRDAGPRFAYEKFTGVKAPTFRIEEINKRHSLGLQLD